MSAPWQFGDLQMFGYDVIIADPPWNFELYSEAGAGKSAQAHYDTMTLAEICALRVGDLARGDCLLLLWCCEWIPPAVRQEVLDRWGFTYKTIIVWRKVTRAGKVRMGSGYRLPTMPKPVNSATIWSLQPEALSIALYVIVSDNSLKFFVSNSQFFDPFIVVFLQNLHCFEEDVCRFFKSMPKYFNVSFGFSFKTDFVEFRYVIARGIVVLCHINRNSMPFDWVEGGNGVRYGFCNVDTNVMSFEFCEFFSKPIVYQSYRIEWIAFVTKVINPSYHLKGVVGRLFDASSKCLPSVYRDGEAQCGILCFDLPLYACPCLLCNPDGDAASDKSARKSAHIKGETVCIYFNEDCGIQYKPSYKNNNCDRNFCKISNHGIKVPKLYRFRACFNCKGAIDEKFGIVDGMSGLRHYVSRSRFDIEYYLGQYGIKLRAVGTGVHAPVAVRAQGDDKADVVRAAVAHSSDMVRFEVGRTIRSQEGRGRGATLAAPVRPAKDIGSHVSASSIDVPGAYPGGPACGCRCQRRRSKIFKGRRLGGFRLNLLAFRNVFDRAELEHESRPHCASSIGRWACDHALANPLALETHASIAGDLPEEQQRFATGRVFSDRAVATDELHVTHLALAVILEDAVFAETIGVSVLPAFLSGDDDDDRVSGRGDNSALLLTAEFAVNVATPVIGAPPLESPAHQKRPRYCRLQVGDTSEAAPSQPGGDPGSRAASNLTARRQGVPQLVRRSGDVRLPPRLRRAQQQVEHVLDALGLNDRAVAIEREPARVAEGAQFPATLQAQRLRKRHVPIQRHEDSQRASSRAGSGGAA